MYYLKLKHHFDSAHKLELDYESPCQRYHGHRWVVIVKVWSETLNKNGMIADFKTLKGIINQLDHRMLNDLVDFNPTAENLVKYLHNEIKMALQADDLKISRIAIELFESPEASVTYED